MKKLILLVAVLGLSCNVAFARKISKDAILVYTNMSESFDSKRDIDVLIACDDFISAEKEHAISDYRLDIRCSEVDFKSRIVSQKAHLKHGGGKYHRARSTVSIEAY